jgi:hypothetical protein
MGEGICSRVWLLVGGVGMLLPTVLSRYRPRFPPIKMRRK